MGWSDVLRNIIPDNFLGFGKGGYKKGLELEFSGFSFGREATHFPDNYCKYVEIYRDVYIVNNVIGKISKLVSQVNFTSTRENDPLVAKFENPNDKQSKEEFLQEFTAFLDSSGWTAIWLREKSVGFFDTMEIINLNPDDTDELDNGNISTIYEGVKQKIDRKDVMFFYDGIRLSNGKGLSRLKPLRGQIKNSLKATVATGIQIDKSMTTVVSPKVSVAQTGISEGLDGITLPTLPGQKSQKEEIEERLNSREMRNNIVVASKGLEAQNLATEANGLSYSDKAESSILAICDAFNVGVELTPYGKNATFDNKDVAEAVLVEREAQPLANSLLNSFKSQYPSLKSEAVADFSHLACMATVHKKTQEANGTTITQVIQLQQANLIDEAKAKEMLKEIIG